ncbi:Ig-like domain-containing protein [Dysgonomonas sp. 511]|uniref:Ig-like domain-containing protein n=1 Tax=Dysgonomonas sp. 511 TaxID=2302930 RepID=UPI0013D44AB0|nr:Ig-like domain-containing protein [Dysgonomonas sp. 511]NDV77681.1 hypothetical protein [Dysgonomonas sp. 511]
MRQYLKKHILSSFILVCIATIVTACANMASPSGGTYDLDPPKVVKASPDFNSTNITTKKIVIEFDENIEIERPSENVIITPPQKSFPSITVVNRKLTVELRDTLQPNTTYTIDFTNAVTDSNEKNPLENFSYSFSTGDVVDSLSISGKILTADNLEPVKGMYVGLHSNMEDSAFTKTKFERISRTNDGGEFTIRGVAPGKYKLYGLDDANRDYMYDNPAEAIAFMEAIIEPSAESAVRYDTVYTDTTKLAIDTIKAIQYTRFLPDNIVLRSFKSDFQRQYLQKHERTPNKLTIFFGAPTEMPKLEPLNFESADWAILEKSRKNDTITYWLKDKELIATDTLAFSITYLRTDSLNQSVPYTDTLRFVDRSRKKPEKEEKKKKKGEEVEEEQITFLNIAQNISSTWDTYKAITLEFEAPIVTDSLSEKIKLQHLKDSVFQDIPFRLEPDSVNPRKYTIRNRWLYANEYRLAIDSAAIHSIYGLWNNTIDQKFKVKAEDQYGQLAIRVSGIDSLSSFIELLDKSDKPVRKSRVKDNVALFRDLNPGTYYARIILDANNNGIWDTGDFEKKIQPEMVCYSQKIYEIKAFFEYDEQEPWVIDTTTLASQKPLDITKQKPQDKEARRKKMEEMEEKNRQMRGGKGYDDSNDNSTYNNNNYNNQNQNNNQYNNNQYNNSRQTGTRQY